MKYIFIIISIIIFVLPTFNFLGIPIRFEDGLFLLIIVYYFPLLKNKILINKKARTLVLILFLLFLTYSLSLFFAQLTGYNAITGDYNTIISYLRYIIILCSGFIVGYRIKITTNKLFIYSIIGILLSSILAIIQFYNIGGLGTMSYLLYGRERNITYGISRAIGVLGNPNYAGFFHSIGFLTLLFIKPDKKNIHKLLYITFLTIAFTSIVITLSRTGLVALVAIVFSYLFFSKRLKSWYYYIPLLVLLIIFSVYAFNKSRFLHQFEVVNYKTLNGRVDLIWENRIVEFTKNPVLGLGPQKANQTKTISSITTYDNSFLNILITSGIIGLFLYLYLYKTIIQGFLINKNQPDKRLYYYIILFHLIIFIFYLTSDLIFQIHFTSFYFFMMGVLLMYNSKNTRLYKLYNQIH